MRIVELEIKNWEKYNPRSDVKAARWFKMSNEFFNDPEFYGLSLESRMVWIFLLCTASKKMSGQIKINTQMIADNLKVRVESIDFAIQELTRSTSLCFKPVTLVSSELEPVRKDKVTFNLRPLDKRREEEIREEKKREEKNIAPSVLLAPDATVAVATAKSSSKKAATKNIPTQTTWESYRTEYMQRYGVEPTRNARVNSQIKQFVERVGAEDAPGIAAFFVRHNSQRYTASAHSTGNLLHDAEKLRTEWMRGAQITLFEARHTETKQQIVNVFERHLNASGGQSNE